MDNFEIKSDGCGGFMVEPHINTFSTNKIEGIRYESKLQNNYTTVEQSKMLLELLEIGLPANSADCYYDQYQILNFRNELDYGYDFFGLNFRFIPCWSVGRLIEILNICCSYRHYLPVDYCTVKYIVSIIKNEIEMNRIDFSKLEEWL